VREIAELTARLRDISARGRDVDPAKRAAFLADKDALIARITDADTDREDAADDTAAWPPMPEWMIEQARQTEAEIAAGTYVPGPVDDPARLAARLAELRAARDAAGTPAASEADDAMERAFDELCERHPLPGDPGGPEPATSRFGPAWIDHDDDIDDDVSDEIATANPHIWGDPSPPTGGRRDPLSCVEPRGTGRVDEQERREQLTRWHVDDQAANAHTDHHADAPDDALTRFTCGGDNDQPGGTP
jgi:hypothetical protein